MDLTGYEVPRVLVTCRSKLRLLKLVREKITGTKREELFRQSCFGWVIDQNDWIENCILIHFMLGERNFAWLLVTGLRFRVENLADYDDVELRIPFRRRVFSSYLDGEHITGNMVFKIIDDELFDRLHDDDAVSLCCLGILQLVLLGVEGKRRIPDWMLRLANDRVELLLEKMGEVYGNHGSWFFHGNLPVVRLTPDETEARSDWWIYSKAYFDDRIGQVKRVRQANKGPIIVSQHYEISDLSEFPSMQVSTWWSLIIPNTSKQQLLLQYRYANALENPKANIPIQGKREQRPSFYKRSPYMEQPSSTLLPKKHDDKTNNNVKKSNLSPLNLGNAFNDDNEGGNDVIFLGGQFTGNYLVYENVDVSKARRENYVDYMDFLNNPEPVYLDCYMKGYLVPVTFWQQLLPHLCMPDFDSNTQMGWLSREHMNSWMELLIRNRPNNALWTVAYTNTISVHPENQRFLIEKDQHAIGTLDGSTRPYPAWNDVNWVFMPIHVGGNH
nr:hypothetical protein [Tanacetum cinerariifolium]